MLFGATEKPFVFFSGPDACFFDLTVDGNPKSGEIRRTHQLSMAVSVSPKRW